MFIIVHHQNFIKTISAKNLKHQQINISSTSLPSHPSGGFPRKSSSEEKAIVVLLRIHGCIGLEELLNHGVVAGLGCEVQRCFASGAAAPWPSRRQNPAERQGPSKFRCLEAIKLVEKDMSTALAGRIV